MKKFIWVILLAVFLGSSAAELACTRKTSLQKKTMAYKKKAKKGKPMPCPCESK
ncbi:hypothetical protein [Adhaeribacter aquaticus]|uniref:hypothetical protein n=1 Tax=Adhaeribacter aquaticus TaxID=299567 RepID=UPI0012FCA306|nr:hypothetical protein [Adhaeribacter aquaticus]